ncbi:MAG: ABC transporter permease [Alphaproteobacteria bacterium]
MSMWVLRFVPAVTLTAFLAPVLAGLAGTALPAMGFLPVIGGNRFSLEPWRVLLATPGLLASIRLTVLSGFLATSISLALVFAFCAAAHDRPVFARARRLLAPLMAVPHAAVAIGLAFIIAPSGWLVRLASPWPSGWQQPPDALIVQDPLGLALVAGLVLKETPFLLLMTVGALGQAQVQPTLTVARSLGYGPVQAWLKGVLPRVYAQLRLPVYAVLAFSLSVVDMALVLAPSTPAPLAVEVFRWFRDPDLGLRFVAAAGAVLQVAIVALSIALWAFGERVVARLGRRWLSGGARGHGGRSTRILATAGLMSVFALATLGIVAMGLWSLTWRWRYPDAFPSAWTLDNWTRHMGAVAWPFWVTVTVGISAALIALALVLGCLENEKSRGVKVTTRAMWLLYTPLIVPQIGFLFGVQILLIWSGLDGALPALVWAHLLFVLPYVYLALADPYRAFDDRYAHAGQVLGASPWRVFWSIKAPMLLRSILLAAALGFAVSVAQYLATVFAGGGRFATLTTEAISLAAGADRRVTGTYVLLQAVLPLVMFAGALGLPAWLHRNRAELQVAR